MITFVALFYISLIMKKKHLECMAGVAFTIVALLTVESCSSSQESNSTPYFSGEGKCPVCGTVISKHPVALQQSTADKSLMYGLLSKDYTIKEYTFDDGPHRMVWQDDSITEVPDNLVAYFKSTRVNDVKSMIPRGTTICNTDNDVFLYFTEDDYSNPQELRLRIQYYADDPLNYVSMDFAVDGFDYKFTPRSPKRGKGEGAMIWEVSDDEITKSDKDLVYALTHAQYYAKCKLRGADGLVHVKPISDEQLESMKRTLQLYLLKGGSFN